MKERSPATHQGTISNRPPAPLPKNAGIAVEHHHECADINLDNFSTSDGTPTEVVYYYVKSPFNAIPSPSAAVGYDFKITT